MYYFSQKNTTESNANSTITALFHAAKTGDLKQAKILLKNIKRAETYFHLSMMSYFIHEMHDISGETVLLSAAQAGHANMVQLLYATLKEEDKKTYTCDFLRQQARQGKWEVVRTLIQAGIGLTHADGPKEAAPRYFPK